jgi:type I restriction enzyme S subunit
MSFPRYPAYKDSGVEWLGEVPEHWTTMRLKYLLAEVDRRAGEENLELLGLSKSLGVLPRSQIEQSASESFDYTKYKVTDPGHLVMNKMQAWNGVFGLAPSRGMVSPDYSVFRFIEPGREGYLESLLRTEVFAGVCYTRSRGMGTAFLRLNTGDLLDIRIPSPPLDEIPHIRGFLDRETAKIDALVAEQERLIALLQEKRQAVISHAVTKGLDPTVPMKDSGVEWLGEVPEHWEISQLRRVVRDGTSVTYGIVQAGPDIEGGVPYIRTSDMSGDALPVEGYLRTSSEIDAAYSRSKVAAGDLVIAIRASVGKCLPVPPELDGANLTQGTAKISPGALTDASFLLAYMSSSPVQTLLDAKSKGATFKEITLETLRKTPVLLPPRPEQEEIANRVRIEGGRFTALIAAAESAKILLKERRAALISAAVTGQIDVRNVTEIPASQLHGSAM